MYTYYLAGNSLAILDYNVPLDQTTSIRCLSFWYFMSGSVGTLSVGLKAGSTDGDYVIAWYRSGNHGSRWRQGQLQIPANYPRIFQVTLLTLLALCDGNPPVDSLHKGTVIWVHWCFRVADVTGPLCWESPVDYLHKGTVRWGVYVFIIPPPNEVGGGYTGFTLFLLVWCQAFERIVELAVICDVMALVWLTSMQSQYIAVFQGTRIRYSTVCLQRGDVWNVLVHYKYRTGARFAPSQWKTSLQSNTVSHWLSANLESALKL